MEFKVGDYVMFHGKLCIIEFKDNDGGYYADKSYLVRDIKSNTEHMTNGWYYSGDLSEGRKLALVIATSADLAKHRIKNDKT